MRESKGHTTAYIITDLSTDKTYDAADRFDLEDALNAIFDRDERAGDSLTIGDVIDALVAKVAAGEYSGEEEAVLNVSVGR